MDNNHPPNVKDGKPQPNVRNRERPKRPQADAARIAHLAAADVARRTARTELFKDALNILKKDPKAADVEECKAGGSDVCVPSTAATKLIHPTTIQPLEIGRRVAYLIGNNDYKNGIPVLETPKGDVEAIGKQLQEMRNYDVKIINNASKADIIRTLKLATRTTALHQSVLVMYAGHGYQINETGQGYWIPVDATPNDPKSWVSNSDITKLLSAIPAKQIILISDSCFSGTLAKEQSLNIDTGAPRQDLLAKRSVLALTSGGEEPVSDEGREGHSIFAATLIEQLQSIQASTTIGQLFEKVKSEVTREFPQVPQLGAVNSAGHTPGGDYLIDVR